MGDNRAEFGEAVHGLVREHFRAPLRRAARLALEERVPDATVISRLVGDKGLLFTEAEAAKFVSDWHASRERYNAWVAGLSDDQRRKLEGT